MKLWALCLSLFSVASIAQTYTVSTLVSFPASSKKSAVNPFAPIIDPSGNIYGLSCCGGAYANGTLFKVTAAGKLSIIYSFGKTSTDGWYPSGILVRDSAGNFYGETQRGGKYDFGTIFKVTPAGKETILYSFADYAGGSLARDSAGNLYGYMSSNNGNLFKLTPNGTYSVLYTFCSLPNCTDGFQLGGGSPILKPNGMLYGEAYGGANNWGVVFDVTSSSGQEVIVHDFAGGADGEGPGPRLMQDSAGNLYGMAGGGDFSGGVIFKIDTTGNYSILYNFCSLANCADGDSPQSALVEDKTGNLYGITSRGGSHDYGTVFQLTPSGVFSVLYNGNQPGLGDGLAIDKSGNLYGTSPQGGPAHNGSVYKLTKK